MAGDRKRKNAIKFLKGVGIGPGNSQFLGPKLASESPVVTKAMADSAETQERFQCSKCPIYFLLEQLQKKSKSRPCNRLASYVSNLDVPDNFQSGSTLPNK